jgi:hypothetical protein
MPGCNLPGEGVWNRQTNTLSEKRYCPEHKRALHQWLHENNERAMTYEETNIFDEKNLDDDFFNPFDRDDDGLDAYDEIVEGTR